MAVLSGARSRCTWALCCAAGYMFATSFVTASCKLQDSVSSKVKLVSLLQVPGSSRDQLSTDTSFTATEANTNRLGGFGSDVAYDYLTNTLYLLSDRGPGGGVIAYQTRWQEAKLDFDLATGVIRSSYLNMSRTVLLDHHGGGSHFNGLNPTILQGRGDSRGLSLDPEGVVLDRSDDRVFVSEEYGPDILEFSLDGFLRRALNPPVNILPRLANGSVYLASDDLPSTSSGRQSNAGYEGLTMCVNRSKLYAVLQEPLMEEAAAQPGIIRIVRYDVTLGRPDAQYVYLLESHADVNTWLPEGAKLGEAGAAAELGVNAITAINETHFLVLERDSRGFGVQGLLSGPETPQTAVGAKRVYLIDISGATDVSNMTFANMTTLPQHVKPVTKALLIDVAQELNDRGCEIPEKLEGLTLGPQLDDGSLVLIITSDNDYSVTQDKSSSQQHDVYYDPSTKFSSYHGRKMAQMDTNDTTAIDQKMQSNQDQDDVSSQHQGSTQHSSNPAVDQRSDSNASHVASNGVLGTSERVPLNDAPKNASFQLLPSFIVTFKVPNGVLKVANLVDFANTDHHTIIQHGAQDTCEWYGNISIPVVRRGDLDVSIQINIIWEIVEGQCRMAQHPASDVATLQAGPAVLTFSRGQRQVVMNLFHGGAPQGVKDCVARLWIEPLSAGTYAGHMCNIMLLYVTFNGTANTA